MNSSQLDTTQNKLIEFAEFKNLSDDYLKVWGDTVVTPQFTDDESVKKEQHSFGWGQIETGSIFDSYGDVASYKSDPSAPPITYGHFNQLRAKLNGAVFHTDANVNRLTDFLFDDSAGNKLRVEATHYNQNQKQVEYLYTQEARFLCARYDADISATGQAFASDVADPKIINRLFPTEITSPVDNIKYGTENVNEIFDGTLRSVVKATFDSYNDARHFFNAGGFVFFQLQSDEADIVDTEGNIDRSWSGLFHLLNQIRFTAMHTYANGGAWAPMMTYPMQEMNAPFETYNTYSETSDKRRGFYSLKDTTREVFRVRIGSVNPIYATRSAVISGEYLGPFTGSNGAYGGGAYQTFGSSVFNGGLNSVVDTRQWPYHYDGFVGGSFSSSSFGGDYGAYGSYGSYGGTYNTLSGDYWSSYLSGQSDRRDLAIYARAEDNTAQPGGKFIIYFQIQLEEDFPDTTTGIDLEETASIQNLTMDAGSYTPADIPAGNSSINNSLKHNQVFYQFKERKMPVIELDTSWIAIT